MACNKKFDFKSKPFVFIDFHERELDRLPAVVVVLRDAGGDGEDVWVEDDVTGVEPDAVHQEVVGAHADAHLAVLVHGLSSNRNIRRIFHNHNNTMTDLSFLVEGHDDDGGAVPLDQLGLPQELLLAALQRYRVHDAFALKMNAFFTFRNLATLIGMY